jgi:hypothetical protein
MIPANQSLAETRLNLPSYFEMTTEVAGSETSEWREAIGEIRAFCNKPLP